MIAGRFGENGELLFEVELIASSSERFAVEVLLDTGFTGWLAINSQDLEALQWSRIASQIEMQTAWKNEFFDIGEGLIVIEGKEFRIPVHIGDELTEILLGSQWLDLMQLVVNKPQRVLTLEVVDDE